MSEMKSDLLISSVVGLLLLLWFGDDIFGSLSVYPLDVSIFIMIEAYTVGVLVSMLVCSMIGFLADKIN